MIGINAYHQPGVEAGKKAAGEVIALQTQLIDVLRAHAAHPFKIEEIAQHLGSDIGSRNPLQDLRTSVVQPGSQDWKARW